GPDAGVLPGSHGIDGGRRPGRRRRGVAAQTLRYNLSRAGHAVRLCTDGSVGLEMALENPPDLLVLDLMLPGVDGLEICRRLRAEVTNAAVSHVPILILTARDEEIDKFVGLEVGAGDYLTKPISMQELLARVMSLL